MATDRDLGFNGDLLYVISDGDTDSMFRLDTITGELFIEGILDRETVSDYMLNITVMDQGVIQKSTSKQVHVIVDDVNDNAPQFIKSTFSFYFPENTPKGTPVVTLNASDPDLGLNGEVTYHMDTTDTSDFTIHPKTGLLVVAKALDRETKEFYDLTIRATDSNPNLPLSSFAVVRVRVLDFNDVEPQFSSKVYKIKAREDLPIGTVIGMVDATDPDLYQHGLIKFSLKPGADDEHFSIDEVSGTLRILQRLDYETKQLYNLTVKATDEGSPPLSSFANMFVEVVDVNENQHPPRFESFFLRTAVLENMPVGSHVATVTAKDMDSLRLEDAEDAKISYSIKGGDGLGDFFIDGDGNIKTLTILDREAKKNFWLIVIAQDHGAVPLASRLDIFIEVLNVNDNVPLTIEPVYTPSIAENSKPWTPIVTLEAEDGDDDESLITYEIVSGNPQSLFTIDTASGLISTTTRMLDREAQVEHILEVLVSDNSKPVALNSTTRVIVTVTDENDNKPEFLERFYKVTVPTTMIITDDQLQNDQVVLLDNDPSGNSTEMDTTIEANFEDTEWITFGVDEIKRDYPLFRSLAYDRDSGLNGQLMFSLKTTSDSMGKFMICPSTGIVYAAEILDIPDEEYEMLIRASDRGSKELFSLSRVSLSIAERASNGSTHPPRILEKSMRVQVFETDPIGHLVALVVADDKDGDQLFYSITDGNLNNDFYISPDKGNLVLAQSLDFDTQSSYNLTISVTDGKFVTLACIVIDIIEVGEKRPIFSSKDYEVSVVETEAIGTVIIQVNTTMDVSYGFHAAQNPASLTLFRINPMQGEVSLRNKLDMERIRQHVLIIVIKDSRSSSNFARLTVNVIDANDHEPNFMTDLIQTRLQDTADIGSLVIQVQAFDGDHGLNGDLRYSIVSGNDGNTFVIDPMLGTIALARAFEDIQTEFMLMVRATDQSAAVEDRKSATVPVHILLTSGDDSPPRFTRPHFSSEVREDVLKGSLILHAEATGNSGLLYEIVGGHDMFVINPSTGHITNQWELDFERRNFYNFTVAASNTIGIKTKATVNIHVLDVNDNRPAFEKSLFKGHVSETASVGSLVLIDEKENTGLHLHPMVIKASDKDTGINALLSYEILDAEAKQYFAIDEATGALRTISSMDYESNTMFKFEVRVSDRGVPRLTSDSTTSVTIRIDDENDSPPKFTNTDSEALMLLPTFTGVHVMNVYAEDPDLGLNTTLFYSIIGGNEEGIFTIDSVSGLISVAKAGSTVGRRQYNLDVGVTDGKFNDRKLITINVEKSDNSGLAFGKPRYFATVLENSTKSDVLAVVTVLGAALNENLRFSLLNLEEGEDLFSIGETSGALRTTGKPFDREVKDKYELVVEVRSEAGRGIPRVAHVIVDVDVLDMNDNAPIFMNLPYFAILQRSKAEKDAKVINVHAVDADKGQNGDIYYQLVRGNGELFRVGRKSGLVTLRTTLDNSYNQEDEYTLTIAAYDGGTPPYSAEVVAVIKVVDESVPVFEQQLYRATIREDLEPFSPILSVKANSPMMDDSQQPHKLIFSIEAGNEASELFNVDADSGMMMTISRLDYETKQHHQLRVRATDSLNGGYTETIVLFEIEDVNDCRPTFKSEIWAANISEAAPIGSAVLTVTSSDSDGPGRNSEVEYSLVRPFNTSELSLFSINSMTGEISLQRSLDRERHTSHVLHVMAMDKGPRPLSSITKITVNVLDANDNAPEFEDTEYKVRLSDRAMRGQFVAKVRAIDPDSGSSTNDPLKYAITGGNEHQVFEMDANTGIISLLNLNNFDQTSYYSLNISVSDGIYSSSSRLRIGLVSANSFTPAFSKVNYEVDFAEGQPEGVRVAGILNAVDADRSDSITYSIQSDNLLQLFSIDSLTGEVWSRHMFDREFKATYEIPVTATDTGGRSGFANLIVNIADVNDNHPKFELEEYKANVYANLTKGSRVVKVMAEDMDEGDNAQLQYTIYNDKDDKHNKLFTIDPDTGLISLKKKLTKMHENQVYQFFVRAQDKGQPFQLHSDVPVEVYIMSQLDRPPVFEKRDSLYYIRENSPVGRVIAQLEANVHGADNDLRYRMASSDYINEELFQIDQKGRVIISGRLDREIKALHPLTFLAETETSPTLNAYYELKIQVLDSNDNSPEFQSDPYDITVSEATEVNTNLIQVQAYDLDFGNNGEIKYKMMSPQEDKLFSIDTHSGWISSIGFLDAETQVNHELHIKAEDGHGLSAMTTVRVNVQDVNDNPHKFSQIHYTAAVNEGALPGTIIFQLMTEDADKVAKTKVDFFIRDGDPQGMFAIKSNGEVYVSRPLDRETKPSYRLLVTASDGTFVTEAKVSIEILDDNDNPPECTRNSYVLSVSEDANPGTFLISIEATDLDEGINGRQIFYLSGPDADFFAIERGSGILKTALPLDRERMASYSLTAHAQDDLMPEWECSSSLNINIEDVNDNSPEFSQDVFTASMREDTPVGAIATKIHATDADSLAQNKKLNYALLDSNGGQFSIDSDSGIVRLTKSLDREAQAMFNLTVRAMDQGHPRLSQVASLIILVLDVNDNPPQFASRLYFASVMENVPKETDVVRVLATSKDSGVNADITYAIVGGNEHRKFDIHPKTGVVIVAAHDLDHEAASHYYLTIQAQDGGDPPLSNHASINITVLDTNDNAPYFSQLSYSAMINEAAQPGEAVLSVVANDLDSRENGRVLYNIRSGDRQEQFTINSNTGVVSVSSMSDAKGLDREMISSYVLEIEAADHGTPVKSSTVLVNIDIADVNDNPPMFAEDNYTVYVQEDKSFGYIMTRFSVTDADDSPNGPPFTFDIRAGNEDNAFRVVQDGTLRTAAKFNHKVKDNYSLQIRAFDNGSPPLYSDVTVTVNIIEESQYPPIVIPMAVEVKSYLDDFPGAMVGRVRASDQDPYDQLSYDLVDASSLFDIDHSKGTIIALEGLDVGIYRLNISVTDGKFTSFGEAIVSVDLVTDDMLEAGVILRFSYITPEDFILSYQKGFVKLIKSVMNVRTSDIEILSVQASKDHMRLKREAAKKARALPEKDLKNFQQQENNETIEPELEVLFAVRRNKNAFYNREKVRHSLRNKLVSISSQLGLNILEMQEDECLENSCDHGNCEDVVLMDETIMVSIATDVTSFVGPRHQHEALCQCKEGFTGQRCDKILNECARQPCPPHKMCLPDNQLISGYTCACPVGLTGELCNVNISSCAQNNQKCSIVNPTTYEGKSFAEYKVSRSIERHFSISLGLRTVYQTGTVMYTSGQVDYSILEIIEGKLRYRFNFGSGEGLVTLNGFDINDGQWHQVSLERHGNSAKLSLDNRYEAQGSAPGINDALNLNVAGLMYFGAEVANGAQDVIRGYHGCLDDLRLDGIPLPLTTESKSNVADLMRLVKVDFKCESKLHHPGVCGSQPCQNGGTCLETVSAGDYTCQCQESRFHGAHCEQDINPCASNPCLHEAKCVNLKNDFHCECPPRLSGKRCHYGFHCNPNPCRNGGLCEEGSSGPICQCRGFTGPQCSVDINECLRQNPCHNGGTCINTKGSFRCECPAGTMKPYCHGLGDQIPRTNKNGDAEERDYAFKLEELVGIIASLFGLVLIVLLWVLCRKFKVVKAARTNGGRASYHIQNDFDKENIQLNHHVRHPEAIYNNRNGTEAKLNNLEQDSLYVQRPLISPPRTQQQETAFNYVDTVRSYGSAADELESLPPTRLTSHDYIQSIQKPMAAVAPSVIGQPPQTSRGDDGSDYGAVACRPLQQGIFFHFNKKLQIS